jgi:hypothetical protein
LWLVVMTSCGLWYSGHDVLRLVDLLIFWSCNDVNNRLICAIIQPVLQLRYVVAGGSSSACRHCDHDLSFRFPPVSIVFPFVFDRFRITNYPAPAPNCPAPAPAPGDKIW